MELFEREEWDDMDEVLDDHILKYTFNGEMTSGKWCRMSERERQEYLFGSSI